MLRNSGSYSISNIRVARDYAEHPGRHSVVQLLDHFDLSTSHKCLVLPVMGMDVQSSIDVAYGGRLNRKTTRSVSLQVAMGLDYLWKCGIAHGDGYILAYCGWRLLRIVRFALEKCLVYRTRNLSTFRGPDNISLRATSYRCSQETRWSALPAFDAVLSRRANIYWRTWCRGQDNWLGKWYIGTCRCSWSKLMMIQSFSTEAHRLACPILGTCVHQNCFTVCL